MTPLPCLVRITCFSHEREQEKLVPLDVKENALSMTSLLFLAMLMKPAFCDTKVILAHF